MKKRKGPKKTVYNVFFLYANTPECEYIIKSEGTYAAFFYEFIAQENNTLLSLYGNTSFDVTLQQNETIEFAVSKFFIHQGKAIVKIYFGTSNFQIYKNDELLSANWLMELDNIDKTINNLL